MLKYLLRFLPSTALCLIPTLAQAQTYTPSNRNPVADNTLVGTRVTIDGNNFNITGGLNKGQTLFHSFSDFSIQKDRAANFINSPATRDIITRVTGNNFSDINGLINSNGANFFLINPNGVTFGTNAQLNVGRAFMASMANGINLVDAGGSPITFGTNPNGDAPLLSVAPNVLFNLSSLNIGGGAGQINNFGTLQNITPNQNQYIGLIGGNVNFNGGKIIAPSANVELGGLNQAGTVGFSLDRGVRLPENVGRGNVSLVTVGTLPSIIYVASGGGGNVNIFASDIALTGTGSYIATGILPGFGSPTAQAGDIKLDATGKVTISESYIFNQVAAGGIGNGGNIEIKTGNMAVSQGSQLGAGTFGKGDAGSVKITATGDVSFSGGSAFSSVEQGAEGKGGGIDITTGNLAVTNGAALTASTFGEGDAGSVKITATGNISFDDGDALSTVGGSAVGKGGNVEIITRNLTVTNGAQLTPSTFGKGDAGNVKITASGNIAFDGIKDGFNSGVRSTVQPGAVGKGGNVEIITRNLAVTDGARLVASTLGTGDAGSVKITATGNISFNGSKDGLVSGAFSNVEEGGVGKGGGVEITTVNLAVTNSAEVAAFTRGAGNAGSVKITATGNVYLDGKKDGLNSGIFSTIERGGIGKGGEIEIKADNLFVTNLATVTTSSKGQGDAGDIFLNANKIVLNNPSNEVVDVNNGGIISISLNSKGGDIKVVASDLLLLRTNSLIATDSFSTDKNGNGGNITISSPLIVATPGNNDITANAQQGTGGRINIISQGLFGIQYRPIKSQASPITNDITASSTFGQNGTVNISTPGTDPGKDSNQLPNVPTDASNQISQACGASTRANKFTVTGRGGIPDNADDPLTSDVVWQDARATSPQPTARATSIDPFELAPPAVGWKFDGKGKVTLLAATTQARQTGTSVVCPNGVGK